MIEKIQKSVLFEEAAKKGLKNSSLAQVPDIFKSLLGEATEYSQKYGQPLAPIYLARDGDIINVSKLSNFFVGINRDVSVADIGLTSLENDLVLFNLEMWNRTQLLKNRAMDLQKRAKIEKNRVALGANWIFTETFSTTNNLDMQNTTAWLDTSEGIAFLPAQNLEQSVPVHTITVKSHSIPKNSDLLGSSPNQAFDGNNSTNWRCLFVSDEWASVTVNFDSSLLTGISLDPVGFGIEVRVSVLEKGTYKEVTKAIIYSKKTFPIEINNISELKIEFRSATSILPKVVGIREVVLFKGLATNVASVYSQLLKPLETFTELRILPKGEIPVGTSVSTFFRTSSGDSWTKLINSDWHPIENTNTGAVYLNFTDAQLATNDKNFAGLYGYQIPSSKVPVSLQEGQLNVGLNMIEVSAFRKDWLETGFLPYRLTLEDFSQNQAIRTWSKVLEKTYLESGSGIIIQPSGSTNISQDSTITRSGQAIITQRRLDPNNFSSSISEFKQLNIVPLVGAANHTLNYNYNYKLSFWVYCTKQFSYSGGKYWFYQGYRQTGRRSFRDINKSFGTFTIYINSNPIIGEEIPDTIFTDNTTDVSNQGKGFTWNFNEGWNKVDIVMNIVDPSYYGTDIFDSSHPYLQLSLYPSLFDPAFKENSETPISMILASNKAKPVSEFDLLWNLPKDPTFWAWNRTKDYVLFNSNQLKAIDGYFKGTAPYSLLNYRSISAGDVSDLYVRVDLEKEVDRDTGPILDEYTVMVR